VRKILFRWNNFNVYSYPAMLYVGMIAGVLVGTHVAQFSGMKPNGFAVASAVLLAPALVGARLLFVLSHWDLYRHDLSRIWRRSDGGMAMYGGLVLAVPLSILLLGKMHLPFFEYWDAATFTILVGMVFTRIGCLLNGCCAGRPTSAWCGFNLPDHRGIWQRRIPTQILEIAWAIVILCAAIFILDRKPPPGAIFCLLIVAYCSSRFFLEPLRDYDTRRNRAVVRTASLLLAIAALVGVAFVWLRQPHEDRTLHRLSQRDDSQVIPLDRKSRTSHQLG
jgi:phosphatidylglycerol---prolipoprotein diacylglyceryl transferase